MPFFCDNLYCYRICVFHSWTCYLRTMGGNSVDWIIPDLSGLKQPRSSVNGKINSSTKAKLFGDDPDNAAKYSGTSLRIGVVNQMLLDSSVDLSLAILRCGWSFDSILLISPYILKVASVSCN